MKKIINGKKYDTETAKAVGTYDNGHSSSDFQWLEETLYLKKTGEFFLGGSGGAMTRYSRQCSDITFPGGWNIVPLSIMEAKQWGERHLDATAYEDIFGGCEE